MYPGTFPFYLTICLYLQQFLVIDHEKELDKWQSFSWMVELNISIQGIFPLISCLLCAFDFERLKEMQKNSFSVKVSIKS